MDKHERFRSDAKKLTDVLFESGTLIDEITRDQMNAIEDLIQFTLQSSFNSHLLANKILADYNKKIEDE